MCLSVRPFIRPSVIRRFCTKTAKRKITQIKNKAIYDSPGTSFQPQYLHNLISVQPCHGTRSFSTVTLIRPPSRSSLKITNRSFRYAAPWLWNELPTELRLPRHTQSSPPSPSVAHGSSSPPLSPPSPLSVTTLVFQSELKTWLFGKSFPP